jgi:hypothetical protein
MPSAAAHPRLQTLVRLDSTVPMRRQASPELSIWFGRACGRAPLDDGRMSAYCGWLSGLRVRRRGRG